MAAGLLELLLAITHERLAVSDYTVKQDAVMK
ncbi:hypothetical protein SPFM9_00168 [Salmonella phage SPFM9]|nr:hypothetical protein SPFM9_00168 [Salmonella phage SPFM9]